MKSFFVLLFALCCFSAFSQDEIEELQALDSTYLEEPDVEYEVVEYEALPYDRNYTPPPASPVALREVKEEKWDEASGDLDYSKDVPIPPKQPKQPAPISGPKFDWTAATAWLGNLMQVLAIIAAVAGIAYGIYRMMQAPRNRRIARDGAEITLENLHDYIHETDLQRFLREALARGDFQGAVRLYYLQTIKSLSEKNALAWSKEKTNRDYLREMRAHRLGQPFRDATRHYERVWYGNQPLSAPEFALMEPEFKTLLTQI